MSSDQNKPADKSTLHTYHDVVHSDIKYEWHSSKEISNLKKHKVSFNEACEALCCEVVVVLKESHQNGEERYVYLGLSNRLNLLVVVVTYPEENVTRIISARKANKKERAYYETQL